MALTASWEAPALISTAHFRQAPPSSSTTACGCLFLGAWSPPLCMECPQRATCTQELRERDLCVDLAPIWLSAQTPAHPLGHTTYGGEEAGVCQRESPCPAPASLPLASSPALPEKSRACVCELFILSLIPPRSPSLFSYFDFEPILSLPSGVMMMVVMMTMTMMVASTSKCLR